MSHKLSHLRASAEADPHESLVNTVESYNGWKDNCTESASELESDSRLRSAQDGLSEAIIARFWAKVERRGPIPLHRPELGSCWLWTASTVRGYGQVVLPREAGIKRHLAAHRLALQLALGHPIPPTLQANHHCDRPRCVRPSHLFLGTQQENLADARRKGRLNETQPRTTSSLTPADRMAIYETPVYRGVCVALAKQYGVTKACISVIRKGRFVRVPIPVAQRAFDAVFERVSSIQLPIVGEVA